MRKLDDRLITLLLAPLLLSACSDGGDPGPAGPAPGFGSGPDPLYPAQWHLLNSGQVTGVSGIDINVEPVWNEGIKGQGSVIAIVDNGVQIAHEDLAPNVVARKSWDYLDEDTDPTPYLWASSAYHGTSTAGVAAARDLNGVGVRGVAPRAGIVGYNLLAGDAVNGGTEVVDAMTRHMDIVSASNNSWGYAPDGQGELFPLANNLWQDAVLAGVSDGRGGKGTVYLWAAGNGGGVGFNAALNRYDDENVDNSNYDEQANNPYVMAICAVDEAGQRTPYSEKGANLWVCAPGGWNQGLTTTDLLAEAGVNYSALASTSELDNIAYTNSFIGTSAATPVVSGVVALMLEANPALSWRDVRLILAQTAVSNSDAGWAVTTPASGQPAYNIHHEYGFGRVDANAAVQMAKTWTSVGGVATLQRDEHTMATIAPLTVAADALPVSQSITIAPDSDRVIEYVEVNFDATHPDIGKLGVTLTAPSGTVSVLAEPHNCYDAEENVKSACSSSYADGWRFGSARHLGESAAGVWQLSVTNHSSTDEAIWNSWSLRIHGH